LKYGNIDLGDDYEEFEHVMESAIPFSKDDGKMQPKQTSTFTEFIGENEDGD